MRQTPDKELNALDITVGVITNSDDRIPGILSSLGLNVGSPRHGMGLSSQNSNSEEDINFVVMSYDVGHEKPAREIFDAARALAGASPTQGNWCLHVGDDLDKDYKGAKAADWESVLLCKPDHAETLYTKGIPYITDLLELKDHIIGDAAEVHLQSRQRLRGMRAER
jgi:beta-phosphoglucomutase-like phosphatase (HAD superfamily)